MAWRSGSVKSAIVRSDVPCSWLNSRDGVNEAHGGFAAIDDRYALKFALHSVLRWTSAGSP